MAGPSPFCRKGHLLEELTMTETKTEIAIEIGTIEMIPFTALVIVFLLKFFSRNFLAFYDRFRNLIF